MPSAINAQNNRIRPRVPRTLGSSEMVPARSRMNCVMSLRATRAKPCRRNSDASACAHTKPATAEIHSFEPADMFIHYLFLGTRHQRESYSRNQNGLAIPLKLP